LRDIDYQEGVEVARICSQCGAANPEYVAYCGKCGGAIFRNQNPGEVQPLEPIHDEGKTAVEVLETMDESVTAVAINLRRVSILLLYFVVVMTGISSLSLLSQFVPAEKITVLVWLMLAFIIVFGLITIIAVVFRKRITRL